MTDADVRMTSETLQHARAMADGSGAHLAEQVSIEADRLSGTVQDGVAAAQAASKTYNGLFTDLCVRMVQGSMRNSVEIGEHVLALLRAKDLGDVFRVNAEFMQRQVSSAQTRLLELAGVKGIDRAVPERRA